MGRTAQPNANDWVQVKTERAQRDMDDLKRLIRYVERWRMAHFQSPDPSSAPSAPRMRGDARLSDADVLLNKLRAGMAVAAAEASGAMRGSQSGQNAFLYQY